MEQIVKFISDHPAPAGLPYWAGVYAGCREYILVIADQRIIGVVPNPYSGAGYTAKCEAAVREANARGYQNVSTALAEGVGGTFFIKYLRDIELPHLKLYFPDPLVGRQLKLVVTE